MNESELRVTLLFDGDCAFCKKSATIGRQLRLDCEFTPLQSVDLESLKIDPTRARREVPFHDGRGTILYGHEAIAAALKTGALPVRTLGHVITLKPMNRLSALVYRLISQHRRRLPGGTLTCKPGT